MPPNDPNQQPAPQQDPYANPSGVVSPTSSPAPPQQPGMQQQFGQPASDYEFIVHPDAHPKPKPMQNASKPVRIAVIAGGVLVLIVLLNVIRGVIAGPGPGEKFLSVAQDQQQIIVIATEANKQQALSTINANSSVTTQLSITADQMATTEYMAKNGKSPKPKDLSLMLNGKIITQLEASAAAGTYNETYKTVMTQQLEAYMNNISTLYKQVDGKKGKALLDNNYKSAKLLLQQLQAT